MNTPIMIQKTLHPDALKYILQHDIALKDGILYQQGEHCGSNIVAKELLAQDDVACVFFRENTITLTKKEDRSWEPLQDRSLDIIKRWLPSAEIIKKKDTVTVLTPELDTINHILDDTIRPSLQMDGGDVELLSLSDNTLRIRYSGSCGHCSSSQYGTLDAITSVLRQHYKDDLKIEVVA